jgi:hypothetical protein
MFFCRRNSWAVLYLLAAAVAGACPGSGRSSPIRWPTCSPSRTTSRPIVHLVTATVMLAVAGIQIRIDGGLHLR